jgi:signal transduction histidine kinase
MNGALALLTGGAFLTLVIEAVGNPHPLTAVGWGALFAFSAIVVYGWVDRQDARRRRRLAIGYVALQLAIGFLMFSAATGVGSTLLLMVLVSQSVRLLPLPGAALVTAAVPLVHVGMNWGAGLTNGLGTLAAAVFTAVVTELLQRERRARADLAEANLRLSEYMAQAEKLAATQERIRVGRDIHDGLGHHLTVVQMQLQAARAVLGSDPVRADEVLAKAQHQATEALAEVRRSVAALREPRTLAPLQSALQELAEETSAAGVTTRLEVIGSVRALPAETAESLWRAAQEGLTNVRKHAGAGSARLVLDYRDGGTVRLEVHDDGTGVAPAADGERVTGFGLLGLSERVGRLGGHLDIESPRGGGTTLRIEVPG